MIEFKNTEWNAENWTIEQRIKWQERFDAEYASGNNTFSEGRFMCAFIDSNDFVTYGTPGSLGKKENTSMAYNDAFPPIEPLNPLGTFVEPEENPNGTGLKYDAEKPMYNLIPPVAINSLAEVMTFGARKYQPNSWQNVENGLERYRAALLRHVFAIQRGELVDPESGLNHSAHALACAAFINELEHMESK